jgi:hypothetical protein
MKEEAKETRESMKVCIIKDMMAITQSNGLEFQKLPKHHPFYGEG